MRESDAAARLFLSALPMAAFGFGTPCGGIGQVARPIGNGGKAMRQFSFATAIGIVGMILAGLLVRIVAAGTTSISESWLLAGAVLPVFGVVAGAVLSHRLSAGRDPWPIADRGRRIPFAVLGGILGAATWYVCYVTLAAQWNGLSFWSLLPDPSSLPPLSSKRNGSASDTSVWMYIGLGLVAGAWVTDSAIKKKWT